MTAPRVLCIHGVNTEPDDDYHERWADALSLSGLDIEPVRGSWDSTGRFAMDVASMQFDEPFRLKAISEVRKAILLHALRDGEAVIAHSYGTVLAAHVYATCRTALPPLVLAASPWSSPVKAPLLRLAGFQAPRGGAPRGPCPHLWNREDPICTTVGTTDHPRWTKPIEIEIEDGRWLADEHDTELYWGHPESANALRSVLP